MRALEIHSQELTAELCAERFGAALRRWSADKRNATKRIAAAIGSSPRVVKNYLSGTHNAPAEKLIKLMVECDEVLEEFLLLVNEQREQRAKQRVGQNEP